MPFEPLTDCMFPAAKTAAFGSDPVRFALTPSAQWPVKRPILDKTRSFAPEFIVRWHAEPPPDTPAAGLACLLVANAVILGEGHVIVGNHLLADDRLMPSYVRHRVLSQLPGAEILAREAALPERRIDGSTTPASC